MLTINHVSFLIKDCEVSTVFYNNIFDLTANYSRPDLGYPGVWLDIGSHQIHLIQCKNPYQMKFIPEHGGRDRHVAFNTTDLDSIIERLKEYNIPFTLSKSGRKAIFFRDPDNNVLEVIQA